MEKLEQTFLDLQHAGVTADLIGGADAHDVYQVGIRLRTFGKKLPAKRMIVAVGDTFEEAMSNALAKARSGRWESLDWSVRPWETKTADLGAGLFSI